MKTWNEVMADYKEYCIEKYTKNTATTYMNGIKYLFRYLYPNSEPNDVEFETIRQQSIDDYMDSLSGTSVSSAYVYKKTLNNFLLFLENEKGIERKVEFDDSYEEKESEFLIVEEEDVLKLINHRTTGAREKLILILSYELIMKSIDIVKLTFDDVDVKHKKLLDYELSDMACRIYEDYIKELFENIERWNKTRAKKGRPLLEPSDYVFQSSKSAPPSVQMVKKDIIKCIKNYIDDTGDINNPLCGISAEVLRNSRKAYLLKNGYTPTEILAYTKSQDFHNVLCLKKYISRK